MEGKLKPLPSVKISVFLPLPQVTDAKLWTLKLWKFSDFSSKKYPWMQFPSVPFLPTWMKRMPNTMYLWEVESQPSMQPCPNQLGSRPTYATSWTGRKSERSFATSAPSTPSNSLGTVWDTSQQGRMDLSLLCALMKHTLTILSLNEWEVKRISSIFLSNILIFYVGVILWVKNLILNK